MVAYRLTETVSEELTEGRLFVRSGTPMLTVLIATPTKEQRFFMGDSLVRLQEKGKIEEVNLEDFPKIHPHLYKPIKVQILGRA